MITVEYEPKNKEFFARLISFSRKLLSKCSDLNIEVMTYGSLAYAFYTEDKEIEINDVDFLIHEAHFSELITAFKDDPYVTYEKTPYRSVRFFFNGVKISFHAIEESYQDLPCKFLQGTLNGVRFNFVPLLSLKELYGRSIKFESIKRIEYIRKLNVLASIG